METKGRILVVDDEASICTVLASTLKREGYEVITATSASEGTAHFRNAFPANPFDTVLQDIRMPGISGLELIKQYQEIDPSAIILVITALTDFQTAAEAMRQGAYDFIRKPFDNETDVKPAVERAVQLRRLHQNLKDAPEALSSFKIIGATPEMKEIYDLVRRIAATDSTVLIQGESGTGKELVARSIHNQSSRFSESFLSVNCGAFSENLLESELFGHIKGSFTSAIADKKGLLEVANKGTFFLDEVSELSPALQVKLLRAIEAREFIPVGGTERRKVDVRFIAATNTDLQEQVKNGNFREDLFYRLNVISITLPPLRERKDDIPLLVGYFLAKYNKLMKKDIKRLSDDAMESLIGHSWPGNIRELENVIQRGMALTEGDEINSNNLNLISTARAIAAREKAVSEARPAEKVAPVLPAGGVNLEHKIEEMERMYIKEALQQSKWNQRSAAKLLGLNIRTLRYKIKKYKLNK
ncbi:MAG: sigma-54 dependent transcriptional regulator [Planctomycetota bacterium]